MQKLKQILGWITPRPPPEPAERTASVKVTPPSEEGAGPGAMILKMVEDVQAVLDNDPAARHALEAVLAYPGLHAIWLHRFSHSMWRRGLITAPRLLAHVSRLVTGIEIHPGAELGRRVFIDHGMGVVIGETAVVGDECLIYKGAVLGGVSFERRERHPILGRAVIVGSNACILGPIHVGDGVKVGSNSVVIRDIPEYATVVGVPGRVMEQERSDARRHLDHANLPDPIAAVLSQLIDEVESLRSQVAALKGNGTLERGGRDYEHHEFDRGADDAGE